MENQNEEILETNVIEIEENEYNELKSWKDKYLYLLADFDNYKKRKAQQESDRLKYINEDLIKELLPVLDNIDKCTDASDGVKLIFKQFQTILFNKILVMPDVSKFDETKHNAIMTVDMPGFEDGDIVEVMKKGYVYNDKIIRYPDVVVNKKQN